MLTFMDNLKLLKQTQIVIASFSDFYPAAMEKNRQLCDKIWKWPGNEAKFVLVLK